MPESRGGLPCPKCGKMIHMRDSRLVKDVGRIRRYPDCACGYKPVPTIESFNKTKVTPEIINEIRNAQRALEKTERLVRNTRAMCTIS